MTADMIEREVPHLDDEGNAWIVCDDRRQAVRLVRSFDPDGSYYPLSSYTVRRCYVRPAAEGDWVYDEFGPGGGVMECDRDHPEAVAAWSVMP